MISFRTQPGVSQEPEIIAERAILRVGIVGVAIMLAAIVVAGVMLQAQWGNLHGGRATRAFGGAQAPEEIGIVDQTLIGIQNSGLRQRARQHDLLDQYGWVDRVHGIARIPIERAIDMVAAQATATTAPPAPSATGVRR